MKSELNQYMYYVMSVSVSNMQQCVQSTSYTAVKTESSWQQYESDAKQNVLNSIRQSSPMQV